MLHDALLTPARPANMVHVAGKQVLLTVGFVALVAGSPVIYLFKFLKKTKKFNIKIKYQLNIKYYS